MPVGEPSIASTPDLASAGIFSALAAAEGYSGSQSADGNWTDINDADRTSTGFPTSISLA
jgi:hypothetical protein